GRASRACRTGVARLQTPPASPPAAERRSSAAGGAAVSLKSQKPFMPRRLLQHLVRRLGHRSLGRRGGTAAPARTDAPASLPTPPTRPAARHLKPAPYVAGGLVAVAGSGTSRRRLPTLRGGLGRSTSANPVPHRRTTPT